MFENFENNQKNRENNHNVVIKNVKSDAFHNIFTKVGISHKESKDSIKYGKNPVLT